ncbi:MAG: GIY-YIG nuclease family protein, partial [Candidatus Omnitrophica bacterium]|nr:GIY-YIG nuclease family protein [Candidatus Omnitrophota bacterium]
MYRVYIIQSSKDQRYYIGYTSNLEQRLEDHNRGKTNSLRSRRPFKLVYSEKYRTKSEAIQREKQIK